MSIPRLKVDLLKSTSTWSFNEKVKRALWIPFDILLFSRGPRLLSRLRVGALRLFGADIGQKVLVLGGVRVWCPWNLKIGDFSALGFDVEIYNFGQVTIGDSCVISQYCYLCTASHKYQLHTMPLCWDSITIGPQVWIAAGCFVAPGVSIGEGAVIGAKSVVTKDVAAWTVIAGNPAKKIGERNILV